MISRKENVKRAIEFRGPEHCPANIWFTPSFMHEQNEEKFKHIAQLQQEIGQDIWEDNWVWIDFLYNENGFLYKDDEWGTKWVDEGTGMKTIWHPMEDGFEYINRVTFPDPKNQARYAHLDHVLSQKKDHYIAARIFFSAFERLWCLRGYENTLCDPYEEPEEFHSLKDRIFEVLEGLVDELIKRDVDAIFFGDDWGSQRALIFSPDFWRKEFKPGYAKMFRKIRDAGKHVWFHSCGCVTDVLPDMIDMGLNVLNPVPPQAMDVEMLSRRFGGKLCFNGGLDVQGIMAEGTPEQVKDEVKRLIDLFGKFNGGYIINSSHTVMPETPLDNIIALYEAILTYR